jgi:hypothetical protein
MRRRGNLRTVLGEAVRNEVVIIFALNRSGLIGWVV